MSVTVKHGDKAVINGRRVMFGTVSGYAEQYREDPQAAIARARERRHALLWINLEPIVIADRGYYAWKDRVWADAVALSIGDVVTVEDVEGAHVRRIVTAPNGNFALEEVC